MACSIKNVADKGNWQKLSSFQKRGKAVQEHHGRQYAEDSFISKSNSAPGVVELSFLFGYFHNYTSTKLKSSAANDKPPYHINES